MLSNFDFENNQVEYANSLNLVCKIQFKVGSSYGS